MRLKSARESRYTCARCNLFRGTGDEVIVHLMLDECAPAGSNDVEDKIDEAWERNR